MEFLTTSHVASYKRSSYWKDIISDVFVHLEVENSRMQDFNGQISTYKLRNIQFSDVKSEKQHVFRTQKQISKTHEDFFIFSIQKTGEALVSQGGREAYLKPGDMVVYDSTQPYKLSFENPFSQMVVQVPQALLRQYLKTPELMTASTIDGQRGVGRITSRFLLTAANQVEGLDESTAISLEDTIVRLLCNALRSITSLSDKNVEGSVMLRTPKVSLIQGFILEHLGVSDLSVSSIAAAHGITPRYLHMLFKKEDQSVSRWIWSQRLARCKDDLLDETLLCQSITDVAFKWGFNDVSHFSRSFKKEYKKCPKEFRVSQ